jgi:hypothetical protein
MKKIILDGKETDYQINIDGEVFKGDRKLKVQKNQYLSYILNVDGRKTYQSLHRLLAISYIGQPKQGQVVNHKDGDKYNNNINNLEWCDRSQNAKHAYETLWDVSRDDKGQFKKGNRRK